MHFKPFSSFFQFLPLQVEETYFFRDGLNQGLIRFLPPGGSNLPTLHAILCSISLHAIHTIMSNGIGWQQWKHTQEYQRKTIYIGVIFGSKHPHSSHSSRPCSRFTLSALCIQVSLKNSVARLFLYLYLRFTSRDLDQTIDSHSCGRCRRSQSYSHDIFCSFQ